MTVAEKIEPDTKNIKFRPCIDMSRCLNKLVYKPKVTLDSLSVCEKILMENDYQTVFDLENMYFHIRLHQDSKKFFGFSLPAEGGGKEYFVFNIMCYGFAPAVTTVTCLVTPIKSYLHRLGIRFNIYVDDGRVIAQSKVECYYKSILATTCFQMAGFNIQWTKTIINPSQEIVYQGFITDTRQMVYRLPDVKIQALKQQIQTTLLQGTKGMIQTRKLASVLGNIISSERSHGSIVRIMSRTAQHDLGKAVMSLGWDSELQLSAGAIKELKFLTDNIEKLNGHFIKHSRTPGAVYNARSQKIK